jgi:membrane protease YdiL (CAAX protease family)
MNIFAQQDPHLGVVTLVFLAIGICLVAWVAIIERMASGKPVLPYQPRRRVPWQFWDLMAVMFFFISGVTIAIYLLRYFLPLAIIESSNTAAFGRNSASNPIIQLLAAKSWATLLLCGTSAVVVAPIAEEFFFRVLLQGWLEKVDRAWRRSLPNVRRWMPLGVMPIFITSVIFASQHFHKESQMVDVEIFTVLLACDAMVRILTIIFSVIYMHWRVGATAFDFGWEPKKLLADARLGVITFLVVAVPTYGCMIGVKKILPESIAPDPIPIFFFAIALGLLYNRTHRIVPSIALHMALNASSLALFLLGNL